MTTAPSVVYRIRLRKSKADDAGEIPLHNPADHPDPRRDYGDSGLI
jgi:GTP-binding protein LepA